MLEVLRIRNIAVIDQAEIRFNSGLNILSGETGAGKSIVIEAISLLLGSRASVELIRTGCDEAVIEGLFKISEMPWMTERLKRFAFKETGSELLIKRTVHRAGRHRISVNGELATLSTLQSLCEGLIDLCGQHEHQSLIKANTQLELLDRYGGLTENARNLSTVFHQYRKLIQERELLEMTHLEQAKKSDFLKFQLEEIRLANLEPTEEETLQKEKQLHQTAGTRAQTAESIRSLLESEEGGILNPLRIALQKLRSLQLIDHHTSSLVEAMERTIAETEEVSLSLNRYLDSIDLDPERLQAIQERLSVIANLRRKYGQTIPDILKTFTSLETEYASLGTTDERLLKIQSELTSVETQLKKLGSKLSKARKKIAETLSDSVTGELKDLKMSDAHFAIELTSSDDLSEWSSTGPNTVQFMVQTNRGECCRPLGKIASGGELSRLMLAIRRVIADRGGIGVYLFDEIDAGMGGQTAFEVGKKLNSVAKYNQVICITHLPQVASFADHHWVVRKTVSGKRTLTEVTELCQKSRKEELARMLGGPVLTRKSLENASELIEIALRTLA